MSAERDAILATLRHSMWAEASDYEIARHHRVPVRAVREERAALERRLYTADVLLLIARLRAAGEYDADFSDADVLVLELQIALVRYLDEARQEAVRAA